MKCLEKDRQRRYETANELANDLERHLTCEPIVARPPSMGYRFQKLVRRNKVGFAAVSATTLALVTGLLFSLWQFAEKSKAYERARAAETLATERLEEAEIVSKFLSELLSSPDPSRDGHTVTVAELLRRAAEKLENDLSAHPARRANLQWTIALTYVSLGLHREALPLMEKIVDTRLRMLGQEHSDTIFARNMLAVCYRNNSRRPEAVKLVREQLALCEKHKGREDALTLIVKSNLAALLEEEGRHEEVVRLSEELLATCRRIQDPNNANTLLRTMHNLAICYNNVGRHDEAIRLQEEALMRQRKTTSSEHPDTIQGMINLATSYSLSHASHRQEALRIRERILVLTRKLFGPGHPQMQAAFQGLADSYATVGRYAEAEDLLREGLSEARKQEVTDPSRTEHALAELGGMFADWAWAERTNAAGRSHAYESERLLREALSLRLQRTNATPWRTSEWNSRLGAALISIAVTDHELSAAAREKKFADAERLLLTANELLQQSASADRLAKRDALARLVRIYEAWDKSDEVAFWRTKLKEFERPAYSGEVNTTVKASP